MAYDFVENHFIANSRRLSGIVATATTSRSFRFINVKTSIAGAELDATAAFHFLHLTGRKFICLLHCSVVLKIKHSPHYYFQKHLRQ